MTLGNDKTKSLFGGSSRERVAGLCLVVIDGPDRGRKKQLEQGTAVIGTRADCDLVLSDPTVSRRHSSVELLAATVRIRDLGSKNGTFHLGARIESVELPAGAIVQVGESHLALLPLTQPRDAVSDRVELEGMVGASVPMRRLYAQIERVAPTDTSVLVCGETGTGKELVAHALHAYSPRAAGPFRIFNCGSVQRELLQSALFGHVRGSFTGAVRDVAGAFEDADGGTLFLDEVAELPVELQPSFLRALETRTFQRIGENKLRRSDFRLVCATHQDLEAKVASGEFRQDLFYRLAVFVLQVPALRERPEDIPLLAEHFAREQGAPLPVPAASLCSFPWPGNVRELRNVVQRAALVGWSEALARREKPAEDSPPAGDYALGRAQAIKSFERSYLKTLLERHRGSASSAAREAGLARSYFYRLLDAHGLTPKGRKRD
jgi:DNA-binding NtrC family response regulator